MLTAEQWSRLAINEEVFEGTNSVVYTTRAEPGQLPFMLKVLRSNAPQQREIVRFHQEYFIAGHINSEYVAKVYRLVRDPSFVALEVEDIGGQSLAMHLRDGRPSLVDSLRIAIATCAGLRSIHAASVVHKDISPSNIIWNRESGQLKIIDFGISSLLGSDLVPPEAPRDLEGTLEYMSPEQTGRMNRPLDYRTDLYSLGVTLFKLFTGQLPFASAEPLEIIHCHIARPAPDPRTIAPELPISLAKIITRLLSKSAEERYQSAGGVEADLIETQRRLTTPSEGGEFELGQHDRSFRFIIPAKLYGRGGQAARLGADFERVLEGAMVMTLISGHSGVGKTCLVQELYRPLAAARGRYISGKFDQYQRNVPYTAVAVAFDALCGQIVADDRAVRAAWKQRVLSRLGHNGQVLVEVIPRLSEVIGPQAPLSKVDPVAAKNRFNEAFGNFVEAVCSPAEPLVMFLDDLQWADIGSLELLMHLARHTRPAGLHLVGAFRDNEVEASHPLALMVDELAKAGHPVETIELASLHPDEIAELVADTLATGVAQVAELSKVIVEKTLGNAFFATEFLKGLAADGLLSCNEGGWRWDVAEIASRNITDNVVDFMAQRIRRFSGATQTALKMAACIGNTFDLSTLAIILQTGSDLTCLLEDLSPALVSAVIIPVNREYTKVGIVDVKGATVQFRFQHDRVQQAAYSLIPEASLPDVHLRIGTLLKAHAHEVDALATRLFEIVSHLNRAIGVIHDPQERLELARLNHTAGVKAMAGSAYQAAAAFLGAARDLLPRDPFTEVYELAMVVHLDLARSLYINGQFDQSELLYPLVLAHARTPMDEARVCIVRMDDYHLQGAYDRAIEVQRAGLARLGETLPSDFEAAIAAEVIESGRHLRGRTPDDLLVTAELRSEETLAALRLLVGMWMSAYLVSRDAIVQWCAMRMSNLTLQFGNSEYAAFAYVQYAYICVLRLNDPEAGYVYGSLAIQLADRYDNIEMRGKVYFNFALFVNHWTRHIRTSTELFRKGYLASVEGGDWTYAVYGAANIVSNLLIAGSPCLDVEREAQKYSIFLRDKAPIGFRSFFLGGAYCALLDLQGRTERPGSFDCELLDEADHLATLGKLPIVEAWFYSAKLRSLFLHRRLDEAVAVAGKSDLVREGVPSQIKVAEAYFYSCLIIASHHEQMQGLRDNPAHLSLFTKYARYLANGTLHSAENLGHKHLLIEAEVGRLERLPLEQVLLRYDDAIQSAVVAGYLNNAALGRELKGRFWISRGQRSYAIAELATAYSLYALWGASAKLAQLVEEFPELRSAGAPRSSTHRAVTHSLSTDALDIASIHKAARAISSNLDWAALLKATLPIVMENVGADRSLLVLREASGWTTLAEAVLDRTSGTATAGGGSSSRSQTYPVAAVELAARTGETLFLSADALPASIASDRYFEGWVRSSAICAPIAYHEDTVAVLYLENSLAAGAFSHARELTLSILLSQLATSMKNARMFGAIETALATRMRELERTNVELAERNQEVEAFVHIVSHDLRAPLVNLQGFSKELETSCNALQDKLRAVALPADVEVPVQSILSESIPIALRFIRASTGKFQRLIDALLRLSRSGRQEYRSEQVSVQALVATTVDSLRQSIEKSGATVTVNSLPPAFGDPTAIDQVFSNLIGNALKYLQPGRPGLIEVGGAEDNGTVHYWVRDNGAGIPAHSQHRLFQVFQRFHPKLAEGEGMGLAIVKRVVERHGGKLWAESQEGVGTTFHLTLPPVPVEKS
jgi:predicted ATPase/signal transduction histidine kinase